MKKSTIALLGLLLMTSNFSWGVGKIQNEDVKSVTDLTNAGSDQTHLINDDKIYVKANGIDSTLNAAIVAGSLGGGGGGGVQFLTNPSFDSGSSGNPPTGWTLSTISGAIETSIIYSGKQSEKLTYTSQTGSLSQSVTPTVNTNSITIEASCKVLTTMTTIEVCGVSGGVLQNCQSVPSTGSWQFVSSTFVGPSNGTTVGVQVDTTMSGSGTVYVDDCYVGPSRLSGAAAVPVSWSGIMSGAPWLNTSSSLSDFPDNGGVTLTERFNRNFGTVTPYGSEKPGITFTPARTGRYFVCAVGSGYNGSGDTSIFQLNDTEGTPQIISDTAVIFSNYVPMSLCGILNVSSLIPYTVRIQSAALTGGTSVLGFSSGASITWTIIALDAPMPAVDLSFSLLSSQPAVQRVESGKITNSGSAVIAYNPGSWISSAVRNSLGLVTVSFTNAFSVAPTCTCSVYGVSSRICSILTDATTSSVQFSTSLAASVEDDNFQFVCVGQK